MTPAEFDRLAASTDMWPVSRQMARRILVDGLSAAEAGREVGKSRSEASRAAGRIRAQALQGPVCPTCHRPIARHC